MRVLSTWVSAEFVVNNTIKRENVLSSQLTKKLQGRVLEACYVSSLLYGCKLSVWYTVDAKRFRCCIDKLYICAWNNRKRELLTLKEVRGVNM